MRLWSRSEDIAPYRSWSIQSARSIRRTPASYGYSSHVRDCGALTGTGSWTWIIRLRRSLSGTCHTQIRFIGYAWSETRHCGPPRRDNLEEWRV